MTNRAKTAGLAVAAALLAACAGERSTETSSKSGDDTGWRIAADGDLNDFFDCLDEAGAALVSAHRGGPRPGYPENALETFAATLRDAPVLIELDVAMSADGVPYLLHDDTFDRTTTGTGPSDGLDWDKISALKLKDESGAVTDFAPPSFADALAYLKTRTITQVDFKRATRYEPVIEEIYRQNAADRVILIAYSIAQARKLNRLAPQMMISLSMDDERDLARATEAGVSSRRLLGFTGLENPDRRLYAMLQSRGVEVIFGTLGGATSIDSQIARDGDDSAYADLAADGVDIIATDRPIKAAAALADEGRAGRNICGISKV